MICPYLYLGCEDVKKIGRNKQTGELGEDFEGILEQHKELCKNPNIYEHCSLRGENLNKNLRYR